MRKLLGVLASTLLLASAIGSTPVAVFANSGRYGCINSSTVNLHTGRDPLTPTTNEQAVVADIDPGDSFFACSGDNTGGPSAWIALEAPYDGSTCTHANNCELNYAIIQVGVEDCVNPPPSSGAPYWYPWPTLAGTWPCGSGTIPHYIMAWGGCYTDPHDGHGPRYIPPVSQNLGYGNADASHHYRIDVASTPSWHFNIYIDNVLQYTSTTDAWAQVACWAQQNRDPGFRVEKWDQGDNASGSDFTVFNNMQRKYGNVWYDLNGTTCEQINNLTPHNEECSAQGPTMYIDTNP